VSVVNELADILRQRSVSSVFQPIVDLDSNTIVAYEALTRGPAGVLHRPDALFDAARSAGRLAELDELCRITAVATAIKAQVFAPLTLFVNVEPEILDTTRLDEMVQLARDSPRALQLVLELTERALATRPAQLLATVSRLRTAGWRIALDDVGADDMSLAFMPLLQPDIVKLDLSLVQKRPDAAVAEIMNAVNAYAESTGALLLAEGIESDKHLMMARALGAQLGQGWKFGRPSQSTSQALPVGAIVFPSAPPPAAIRSPFNCLPTGTQLRVSAKPLLIEISKSLERQAMRFGGAGMVVSTFQQAKHFTAFTSKRYRSLVDRGGFVAAIGEGLSREPIPGLRGADLANDDPVRTEWDIVVLAPHFSAALLARDLGDKGPDQARRFEFALTYDRATVIAAAQSLLSRVLPADWVEPGFTPAIEVAAETKSADGTGTAAAPPASPASTQLVQPDGAVAFLDPLTGLLNRSRFQTLLESALLQAQMTDGGLAIVHFEIDKFSTINTEYGHLAADVVLQTIAQRLTKRFRRTDLIARLGDDEFVVLLAGLDLDNAAAEAQQVADGCVDGLQQPITTQRGLISTTINIGVSCYPADGNNFDALTQAADQRKHSDSN